MEKKHKHKEVVFFAPEIEPLTDSPIEQAHKELLLKVHNLFENNRAIHDTDETIDISGGTLFEETYETVRLITEHLILDLTQEKIVQAVRDNDREQLEEYECTLEQLTRALKESLADDRAKKQKLIDEFLGGEPKEKRNLNQTEFTQQPKHHNWPVLHTPIINQWLNHGIQNGYITLGRGRYKTRLEVRSDNPLLLPMFQVFHGYLVLKTSNPKKQVISCSLAHFHRSIYNINTKTKINLTPELENFYKETFKILNTTLVYIYENGDKTPSFEPLLPTRWAYKTNRHTGELEANIEFLSTPIFYRDAQQKKLITNYSAATMNRIIGTIRKNEYTASIALFVLYRYEQGKINPNNRRINLENFFVSIGVQKSDWKARYKCKQQLEKMLNNLKTSELEAGKDAQGFDLNNRLLLKGWHYYYNKKNNRHGEHKNPSGISLEYFKKTDTKTTQKSKKSLKSTNVRQGVTGRNGAADRV